MRDALAGLDIGSVRLADAKNGAYRRFRNVFERGLHVFYEYIASQPSGQVRWIPIPDGLLVRLLGGRTLREELRALCCSASLVEIPTSYRQTAFGAKATISPPEFFPTVRAETINLRSFDRRKRWAALRFALVSLSQTCGRTFSAGSTPQDLRHVFSPRRD